MTSQTFNVLVLCTGNSARSILAEALINRLAGEAGVPVRAWSAGSRPKEHPHPAALETLQAHGIATDGLRSKSWDEFALPSAPPMDLVITVCDNAAGETCPIWPGAPVKVHWGLPDPAAATGSEEDIHAAFQQAYDSLHERISRLLEIAGQAMEPHELQARLQEIHNAAG
jgi:arsenate reductase